MVGLIFQGYFFRPDELPKGTRIVVPPVAQVAPDQTEGYTELVKAAQGDGFEVEIGGASQIRAKAAPANEPEMGVSPVSAGSTTDQGAE